MKKLLFLFLLLTATIVQPSQAQTKKNSTAPKKAAQTETQQAPMVGNDKDEHGCIGSAGYTWSKLKNKCIRTFEDGIKLEPKAANLDKTTVSYLVFPDANDSKAELFIPSLKTSVILIKSKKQDEGNWSSKLYKLSQYKGMYTLKNTKGKVLYEGMAK